MEKCEMFCYQCQETARGTGCTKVGVCGKRPELSGMLDLLVYVTKGLSCVTTMLREEGKEVGKDVNHLVTVNLFATITNANFDRDAIIARIKETLAVKEELRAKLVDPTGLPEAAVWNGNENEFDSKLALGDIGGIPRVLDAGQCNDSYSLALIALKLKEVFGLDDINDLPIAFNIAWYEQKAVIVLLALLYLGVKNIHLGPTLPGFLSPNVAKVLVENFGIAGIGTVDEDLKLLVGETA